MRDYKFGNQQNAVENIDTQGEYRPEFAEDLDIKKKGEGDL